MFIPKIIHQIAPKDKSRWHPLWHRCQESWLKHFSEFKYKLWDDEEGIDNLVKEHFPQYISFYNELPVHIMRIDFARFCILYQFGGIYADMDMFCFKNFYNTITKEAQILEAPYGDVFLENALMSSTKNSKFFMVCIQNSIERYNTHVKNKFSIDFYNSIKDQKIITSACGPDLVCSVYRNYNKEIVGTFSGLTFNNHGMSYHPSFYTKHVMTGLWGKEAIDNLIKSNVEQTFNKITTQGYIKEISKFVNVDFKTLDDFDFYKDYTNGGYLKNIKLDYDKNNIDNDPLTKDFTYS